MERRRRVMKLGGSLLTLPDVGQRLTQWLKRQPPSLNLMIVGGGEMVEAVRVLDAVHHFEARQCHWLCVKLLEHTARLAHELLPSSRLLETEEQLAECLSVEASAAALSIVQVAAFYSEADKHSDLPENWDTTSDSIAALLARCVQADELVLFKSHGECEIPALAESLACLHREGIVDAAFPAAAAGLPRIALVNLRAN